MADSQQEQWAEVQAKFCDHMVKEYREKILPPWLKRPEHPSNLKMALECSIYAEAWEQMARHLRMPKMTRLENDQ